MAIPNTHAMRFTPSGLVDAFDASRKFEGACQKIVNLIFDQSNPELVISRPGVTQFVNFADNGFANPNFISIQAAVGDRIYGMIGTSRNPGRDEPFCYDTSNRVFIPISDVVVGNVPFSPPTFGEWTPPTLTVVGTMIVITHEGFTGVGPGDVWGGGKLWGDPTAIWGGGANFYGIIDVTDPANPSWRAENTAVNPLTSVPQAVANFNNRAYFAVKNQLQFTDVLTNPLTRTNADQALVIGDSAPVNALAGLPIQTTSSGVIQSLTTFKQTQVWQITGDPTTLDLAQNYVSLTVGTNAPRSIAQSPYGLYFGSTGGPYFLDLLSTLRPLTHSVQEINPDIVAPFSNAQTPTRWAGAYNSNIYRVCGNTVIRGLQNTNDYWFDEHRRRWNGPHSFTYDCASALAGYFVLSSAFYPGLLMQSFPQQTLEFTPFDLNTLVNVEVLSSTFPKVDWMAMKQVAESQIELAASSGNVSYAIDAQDEQGISLGRATIAISDGCINWDEGDTWDDGALWCGGNNTWGGGGLWGAPANFWGGGETWGTPCIFWTAGAGSGLVWGAGGTPIPLTKPVPWPAPLVFEKMQLQIKAVASSNLAIGTFYARYQKTGYMTLGFVGDIECQ
jgi:hypothetical protein